MEHRKVKSLHGNGHPSFGVGTPMACLSHVDIRTVTVKEEEGFRNLGYGYEFGDGFRNFEWRLAIPKVIRIHDGCPTTLQGFVEGTICLVMPKGTGNFKPGEEKSHSRSGKYVVVSCLETSCTAWKGFEGKSFMFHCRGPRKRVTTNQIVREARAKEGRGSTKVEATQAETQYRRPYLSLSVVPI